MKKLMIAAAIVCAAACLHAASFTWGNSSYSIDNWSGNAPIDADLGEPMYKDGTMFLILGTLDYQDGKGFTNLGDVSVVTSGGYNADQYMYGNADTSAYSTSDLVSKTGGEAYTLLLVNGNYTSLSQVKDGDSFVLRTGDSTSLYDADLGDYTADFQDATAIVQSSWQTYSVPEPTSGLLMLLGVAGLALRRRRA